MKVLYLNHTGQVSGAERSLLDLLEGVPRDVPAGVACPPGPLASAVRRLGLPVASVDGTVGSFRLHAWHTPRAAVDVVRSAFVVRRLAQRSGANLVHANSVRAGLIATLARRLGGPPVVVHVRDCLPPGGASHLARRLLGRGAAMILANSRYTAARFADGAPLANVRTVYNPVDLARFDPDRIARATARANLGLGEDDGPVLGVIAQLTPWKGQDDAIRILARVRATRPGARLLLVGEAKFTSAATRYDNVAYERTLNDLARELGVADAVASLGERADVPEILRALDVLLVPSWEEPFGRVVIEAMAMGTPVVATNVGGPAEIITSGEDGFVLPPRQPDRWAETVARLTALPVRTAELASRAQRRARTHFGRDVHVAAVLDAYRDTERRVRAA